MAYPIVRGRGRPLKDMTGCVFGRLTVLAYAGIRSRAGAWHCRCSYGNDVVALGGNLRKGDTRSCGCLHSEMCSAKNATHGDTKGYRNTPEYNAWRNAIRRCEDPDYPLFHRYGGRGIRMCERWRSSYEAFLADMGRRPSPQHSLDRINNDGNYEPGNCRWATREEQRANRSDSKPQPPRPNS